MQQEEQEHKQNLIQYIQPIHDQFIADISIIPSMLVLNKSF